MTSVLSLTLLSSGNITNTTSAILPIFANSANSRINWEQIADLGVFDPGALWSRGDTHTIIPSNSSLPVILNSLQYDTGSWTDANSTGLFRVPDDKWSYVRVGGCISSSLNNTTHFQAWAANLSYGTAQWPGSPFKSFRGLTYPFATFRSGPLPVSSGDIIEMWGFTSGSTTTLGRYAGECFWIGGYA